MCRCVDYGFQAVQSGLNRVSFIWKLSSRTSPEEELTLAEAGLDIFGIPAKDIRL